MTKAWRRDARRLLGKWLIAWADRTAEGDVVVMLDRGLRQPRAVACCASARKAEWLAEVINLALDALALQEEGAVDE